MRRISLTQASISFPSFLRAFYLIPVYVRFSIRSQRIWRFEHHTCQNESLSPELAAPPPPPSLYPVCRHEAHHALLRIRTFSPEHSETDLRHLNQPLLSPSVSSVRHSDGLHTSQRIRIFSSKRSETSLHRLKQLAPPPSPTGLVSKTSTQGPLYL